MVLAWSFRSGSDAGSGGGRGPATQGVSQAGIAGSRRSDARPVSKRLSSEDYQAAWKALLARPIPKGKEALKKRLLLAWQDVDLDAALAAALRDDPEALLPTFIDKMSTEPESFWPMIRDGRYGPLTSQLADVWINVLSEAFPGILLDHMQEMGRLTRGKAVANCISRLRDRPGDLLAFVRRLSALPDTPENREIWKSAGGESGCSGLSAEISNEEILDRIKLSDSPGDRRLLMYDLCHRLGMLEGPGGLRRDFDRLPEEFKNEAALCVIHVSRCDAVLVGMAGYLVEHQQWKLLDESLPGLMKSGGGALADQPELTAWALALPERDEVTDVYRSVVGVRVYRTDLSSARAWLEEVPAGWKRDQALVGSVIAISGIVCCESPEGRAELHETVEWALGRIQDPGLRSEAEKKRGQW
ncbi:MAG: hypothetical protein QM755_09970 [Luteolibacter sp.]